MAPSTLASWAKSRSARDELVEPGWQLARLGLGDVLEHEKLDEGGERRRADGKQRHEEGAPGDGAALVADGARHAAPRKQARQRRGAKGEAEEQRQEIRPVDGAEGLQEGFGAWPRLLGRQRGREFARRRRRDAGDGLRALERLEHLAIGELRRRQIGEHHRDDDQRHGEADRAHDELSARAPGERAHAADHGDGGDHDDHREDGKRIGERQEHRCDQGRDLDLGCEQAALRAESGSTLAMARIERERKRWPKNPGRV